MHTKCMGLHRSAKYACVYFYVCLYVCKRLCMYVCDYVCYMCIQVCMYLCNYVCSHQVRAHNAINHTHFKKVLEKSGMCLRYSQNNPRFAYMNSRNHRYTHTHARFVRMHAHTRSKTRIIRMPRFTWQLWISTYPRFARMHQHSSLTS